MLAFSSTLPLSYQDFCHGESSGTRPRAKGQTLTASCSGPKTLINSPDSCLSLTSS